MVTRGEWAESFLTALDAPDSRRNRIAMVSWIASEGGLAKWNPLNCVMDKPGATLYNQNPGVKNYISEPQGMLASVETILGKSHNYELIIKRLRDNAWPSRTLRAVYDSDWGTQPIPYLLRSVKRSYDFYANQPIGQ